MTQLLLIPETAPAPDIEIRAYGIPGPQGSKNARIGRKNGTAYAYVYESSEKVKPWRECVLKAAVEAMGYQLGPREKAKPWREFVTKGAARGMTYRPLLINCPVTAQMVFTMPRPKGRPARWPKGKPWSKTVRIWPAGYPDLSKLLRSTEDALTEAGVWSDDGRVVEYTRAAKLYLGDEDKDVLPAPGALIRIWSMVE